MTEIPIQEGIGIKNLSNQRHDLKDVDPDAKLLAKSDGPLKRFQNNEELKLTQGGC